MNDKGGVNFTPKIFKTSFSSKGDKVILKHKYRKYDKVRALICSLKFIVENDNDMIFSCEDIE